MLFFVSVGMLFDPAALLDTPGLLAGTLLIVMVGKPITAFAIVWAMRYTVRTGVAVSAALAQIGEFSFMLSRVGRDLGLLTAEATNVLVAASIVSIVANPLLYRTTEPLTRRVLARPALRRLFDRAREPISAAAEAPAADPAHRAIVVGYGPSGRTVTRLLRENLIDPTVVELNVNVVRQLRSEGIRAVYGDATHPDTLAEAGAGRADNLILTSAGMTQVREAIRVARELNPRIHVLARTLYLREAPSLAAAGAQTIFTAEGEVALAMTEAILHRLGATPEQIDKGASACARSYAGSVM